MYTNIINASDLKANLDHPDWVIVDCRFSLADTEEGRRNYAKSHIPGAFYAHLDDDLSSPIIQGDTGRHPLPDVQTFVELLSSWGVGEGVQVVAYDDRGGGIASRLWWMLRWLGHENAAVLNGGWQEWVKNDFPTDSAVPEKTRKSFHPTLNPDMAVPFEKVDILRAEPAYSLVDSRTAPRYRGEEEPIDPIAGHIPGAINLPFPENIGADGLFKSPEWLKARFQHAFEDKPADHIIFYCGSGVTACHNILAYHYAGLGDALLYPGSWSEWINKGEIAEKYY
ncbi:MAG: sulfurtransferase [Saprospiraceae bacterium]|nr:sulfurtransferase [Saprospiraceae bacterium]MCB9324190.1 sulfurtransferase [Lewinellaceae bacterium]